MDSFVKHVVVQSRKLAAMETATLIEQWLQKTAANIDVPLSAKIFKKTVGEIQIGVQLYRSRFSEHFFVELKIYHPGISSFEEVAPSNYPIIDRRLYATNPICGMPTPPDFRIHRDDPNGLVILRENLIAQGTALFGAIRTVEDLRAYYSGALPGVFIEEWPQRSAAHAAWVPKIEGYLSDRPNGVRKA